MKLLYILLILGVVAEIYGVDLLVDVPPNCDDIKMITDYHNELRQQIANGTLPGQPKASNMLKLAWDDNLAKLAQEWANNAVYKHNAGRSDPRFQVGENIFISYSTSKNPDYAWKTAIRLWFEEYKQYTYGPIVVNPKTGHYTQVGWANTKYVGCGASQFYNAKGMRSKYYVCNYGPSGNFLGQYMYKTGPGCEDLCCKEQCQYLYGEKCTVDTAPTYDDNYFEQFMFELEEII